MVTIYQNVDGYEYEMKLVQRLGHQMRKPSTNISVPGGNPEDATIMAVQGQTRTYNLRFIIFNDGTDRSNGTVPDDGTFADTDGDGTVDVITVNDQITWLRDYIFKYGLGIDYTIVGFNVDSGGVKCHIESLNIDPAPRNVNHVEASMTLKVGEVV